MPLPLIPVILWGAAAITAGVGIKKGIDAKSDFDRARGIGSDAESRHAKGRDEIEKNRAQTQESLEALGLRKVEVFTNQIKYLVDAIKKGRSQLKDFELGVSVDQLKEYERLVIGSMNLERGLAGGAVGGALAAMGAYGAVGSLATASTGAAISGLSGVAATNATLAWLGGGALSAGGFGMAGGMLALGGIALGPALAVGGFMMASKAEEALTKARSYSAEVDVALAEMEKIKVVLKAIRSHAAEVDAVILRLVEAFEQVKVPDGSDQTAFERMIAVGKALKGALDIKILDEAGSPVKGLDVQCKGLLEVLGPEVES